MFAGEQFLLVEEQFVVHTKNGAHCILCRKVFLKKCSFGCFSRGGMQAVAEGRHRQLQQADRQVRGTSFPCHMGCKGRLLCITHDQHARLSAALARACVNTHTRCACVSPMRCITPLASQLGAGTNLTPHTSWPWQLSYDACDAGWLLCMCSRSLQLQCDASCRVSSSVGIQTAACAHYFSSQGGRWSVIGGVDVSQPGRACCGLF